MTVCEKHETEYMDKSLALHEAKSSSLISKKRKRKKRKSTNKRTANTGRRFAHTG